MRIQGPAMVPSASEMPTDLSDYFRELEQWALGNAADAKSGTTAFWVLKAPAVLASALAGLLAYFQWPVAGLVVGFAASGCMLIDSFNPRGALRNTHMRAYHDIRNLTNGLMNQWRSRDRHVPEVDVVRKIISESEAERSRIAQYVRDAESALSSSPKT